MQGTYFLYPVYHMDGEKAKEKLLYFRRLYDPIHSFFISFLELSNEFIILFVF